MSAIINEIDVIADQIREIMHRNATKSGDFDAFVDQTLVKMHRKSTENKEIDVIADQALKNCIESQRKSKKSM